MCSQYDAGRCRAGWRNGYNTTEKSWARGSRRRPSPNQVLNLRALPSVQLPPPPCSLPPTSTPLAPATPPLAPPPYILQHLMRHFNQYKQDTNRAGRERVRERRDALMAGGINNHNGIDPPPSPYQNQEHGENRGMSKEVGTK